MQAMRSKVDSAQSQEDAQDLHGVQEHEVGQGNDGEERSLTIEGMFLCRGPVLAMYPLELAPYIFAAKDLSMAAKVYLMLVSYFQVDSLDPVDFAHFTGVSIRESVKADKQVSKFFSSDLTAQRSIKSWRESFNQRFPKQFRRTQESTAFNLAAKSQDQHRSVSKKRKAIEAKRGEIGAQQGWACLYCGLTGSPAIGPDGRPWHLDHLYASSNGGDGGSDNLIVSCATCNIQKGHRLLADFIAERTASFGVKS